MYLDSFDFSTQLNDLFTPIEKHSNIHINYEAHPVAYDDEYVVDFRVLSVNGTTSLAEFNAITTEVTESFLENFGQVVRGIPKKYRMKFCDRSLDRFTDLMDLVTYERNYSAYRPFYEEPEPGIFLFMQPSFSGNQYHNSPIYMDQILVCASDYAYVWWEVMSQLLDELKILITTIKVLPELTSVPVHDPGFEKIRMRLTVPQLSCLIKLMIKANLIDVTNKTELFKSIAEVFQTKGQDNLSWRNVKNHHDSPSPDAMEFCRLEFLSLSQLASDLLEDYIP